MKILKAHAVKLKQSKKQESLTFQTWLLLTATIARFYYGNSVIGFPNRQPMEVSTEKCEPFLHYFSNKIEDIKHIITPVSRKIPHQSQSSCLTLSFFPCWIHCLSSPTCQLDIVPTRFLKWVFLTVGPDIFSHIVHWLFPNKFINTIVHPHLIKISLDPLFLNNFRPI